MCVCMTSEQFYMEKNGAAHITVDLETQTRVSVSGIFLTQQMGHIIILFHNGSTMKDECAKILCFFVKY
jgi:hypothetical protein